MSDSGLRVVTISAGHGGNQPGGVYTETSTGIKFVEKDLNLDIALAVEKELIRYDSISVNMIRRDDASVDMLDRDDISNAANSDLYVAIHNDMCGGNGYSIFYSLFGTASKELGIYVGAEIEALGQNKRFLGYKKGTDGLDYYFEVREPNAPAILIECAFMDNDVDNDIIDTLQERQAFGVAIAKGILRKLGIDYKEEDTAMKKLIIYFSDGDLAPALLAKRKESCPMIDLASYAVNPEKADLIICIGGPMKEGPGIVCLTGASAEETQAAVVNKYYPKEVK